MAKKILRATISIEYPVETDHYGNETAADMLALDIETDSAATIMNADWDVRSAELVDPPASSN
jgi:hypothetical protein